jgi:P-type Mg2+ transporter
LGQRVDATIIIVMVLLGVSINFVQTYRSQKAIERLRQHVSVSATVLRDGNGQEIKRHEHEVVPDDLVRLSAGYLVPADARPLQARDLYVQQAALIRESMPTEKHAHPVEQDNEGTPDSLDVVFLGTSVVSGTATARVLKTGPQTAFGAIAKRLVVRPQETEFERELRRFGILIMRVICSGAFHHCGPTGPSQRRLRVIYPCGRLSRWADS